MTPTPTEEDLRLQEVAEDIWMRCGCPDALEPADLEPMLAAFRAEARREAEEQHAYHEACPKCWERHKTALRRAEEAEQSEREACERIVTEYCSCEPMHPVCQACRILRRIRERAK